MNDLRKKYVWCKTLLVKSQNTNKEMPESRRSEACREWTAQRVLESLCRSLQRKISELAESPEFADLLF